MFPLALSVRASPPPATSSSPVAIARARLRALPFPPEATIGIPYYDDELDMPQSPAHSAMIRDLGQFLDRIAGWTGLTVFSDNPVWYWIHEDDRQRIFYPDYALAAAAAPRRVTAADVRLALEVVSTERADKERKDTEQMRDRNAGNGVPEFGLLYPEPDDDRSLRWFRLDPVSGTYREQALPANGRFRSESVPGLELEVLAPDQWQPGRKARVWYRGELVRSGEEEARERARAERRAEQEHLARTEAEHLARKAQAENARLLALLRQAGLNSE